MLSRRLGRYQRDLCCLLVLTIPELFVSEGDAGVSTESAFLEKEQQGSMSAGSRKLKTENIDVTVLGGESNTEAGKEFHGMKLMTISDLKPMTNQMREEFASRKAQVDQLESSVAELLKSSKLHVASKMVTNHKFKGLAEKVEHYQNRMRDAFSLLVVQALHSVVGLCCCFHDAPETETCRWNLLHEEDVYFKKNGCRMLGMRDYNEAIAEDTIAGGGAWSIQSAENCGAFVQSALEVQSTMSNANRLFHPEVWNRNSPPGDLVRGLTTEAQMDVRNQWNKMKQLRQELEEGTGSNSLNLHEDPLICNTAALKAFIKEAYQVYLTPDQYDRFVVRLSDCEQAFSEAQEMIRPGARWDPAMKAKRLEEIQKLLQTGDRDWKILNRDLTKVRADRERLEGTIEEQRKKIKRMEQQLSNGVKLWSDSVQAGIPPSSSSEELLRSGLASASDSNVAEARFAALSARLPREMQEISAENDRRQTQEQLRKLLADKVQASTKGEGKQPTHSLLEEGNGEDKGNERGSLVEEEGEQVAREVQEEVRRDQEREASVLKLVGSSFAERAHSSNALGSVNRSIMLHSPIMEAAAETDRIVYEWEDLCKVADHLPEEHFSEGPPEEKALEARNAICFHLLDPATRQARGLKTLSPVTRRGLTKALGVLQRAPQIESLRRLLLGARQDQEERSGSESSGKFLK